MYQARAHTYLGDFSECSLTNPGSWDQCINVFRQARTELEIAQQNVIALETATLQMLQDSQASGADASMVAANEAVYNMAHQSRIDHTSLVNAFNDRVNTLSYIPGFSTVFLSGFKGGLGSLGQFPWTYVIQGAVVSLTLVAASWAIGNVVEIWNGNYKVMANQAKAQEACYDAYKAAIAAGQTPPDCSSVGPNTTAPFLIIGAVVVAAIALTR